MPCHVDPPDGQQIESRRTAICYRHALRSIGADVPKEVNRTADDPFGGTNFTVELCALMRSLTKKEIDGICYGTYNKESLMLADWWREHQEHDRLREQHEAEERRRAEAIVSARRKLSPEEGKAVGL